VTFPVLTAGARHRQLRVRGVDIHHAELGPVSGAPPVVLLHGLHDCHRTWRRVAAELGRDRRVLVPDLPGHGRSGRPDATYDLPYYTDVIGAWLEALRLPAVDVVGHSLGGGVAQMLLLRHRALLRRVVLAAPGGLGREITPLLRLASVPYVVERLGGPFLGLGTRIVLKRVVPREDRRMLARLNTQEGSARAFARTVRDLIDWRGQRRTFYQRAHELGEDLPPIALVWGTRDWVIPARHAEAFRDVLDRVPVTFFEGCGHYLHHEEPARFADVVRAFLDGRAVAPRLRARSAPRGEREHMRAGAAA
jgi:pimeloyl-ACP methyl ester carboxylesterase